MPVHVAGFIAQSLPLVYIPYAVGTLLALIILRKWAAGELPLHPLSLHGRTAIVTGGTSAVSLSIAEQFAQLGAQVIILAPDPVSSKALTILEALRSSTSNERIFVEKASLTSLVSLKAFASSWSSSAKRKGALNESIGPERIAAVVFAPEYDEHSGSLVEEAPGARHFLMNELISALQASSENFLPRVCNIVDPFYVASPPIPADQPLQSFLSSLHGRRKQGAEATLSVLLFREHQRRLQSSPSDNNSSEGKLQGLIRVLVLSVSTGFTRSHVNYAICPSWKNPIRFMLWLICLPLIWLLLKSDLEASQNIVASLLAPYPPLPISSSSDKKSPVAIEPGEFYRDGKFIRLANVSLGDEKVSKEVWEREQERAEEHLSTEESNMQGDQDQKSI